MIVQDLINGSLRLIGAAASYNVMDPDESADNLSALNLMLDAWWVHLYLEALFEESFTLTVGKSMYTVGAGGDFNTARPLRIEDAWIRDANNIDYPIYPYMTEGEYTSIRVREVVQARPDHIFYDPQLSLGKIYLYPTSFYAETLFIRSRKPFTQFATINDSVILESGVARAIKYNFAVEIAPEYNRDVSSEVAKIAQESFDIIRNLHARPVITSTDPMLLRRGQTGNILTGGL